MWSFRDYRRRRYLARAAMPQERWARVLDWVPSARHLGEADRDRLQALAQLFLREKSVIAAAGVELTDAQRLIIAARAVVPVLNLGLDYYDGWSELVVYEDEFVPGHEYVDEAGVVHVDAQGRAGEAWQRGPVILSWKDIEEDALFPDDGCDVVIHEMAHKLDMLNGDANGLPPLHADMSVARWASVWRAAYDELCGQLDAGTDTWLDPYGAESPGEFFAVMSEAFFMQPRGMRHHYPPVYEEIKAYYRQDPAAQVSAVERRHP